MKPEDLLKLLESHVTTTAIVTFHSQSEAGEWFQKYDVTKTADGYQWGYTLGHQLMLLTKLSNDGRYPLAIVVRSFLPERVTVEGQSVPMKALRMYFIMAADQEPKRLPPDEARRCEETNPVTGERTTAVDLTYPAH